MAGVIALISSSIAGAMIGGITLLLFVSVVGRYSGLFSLVWAEEAARAMFVWLSFMGASIAVQRQGHFRLELIESLFPARRRIVFRVAAHGALTLLGLCFAILGAMIMRESFGQFTNTLKIPQAAIYAAIPLCGLFFVIFSVGHIRTLVRENRSEMVAGTAGVAAGARSHDANADTPR